MATPAASFDGQGGASEGFSPYLLVDVQKDIGR